MGIQLTSKYSSTCPECDRVIKAGDKIYYDGDNRNSYGKKIVCTNLICFKEQGGVLDEESSNEFSFVPPKFHSYDNITFSLIDDLLDDIIVRANDKVKKLLPHLPEDSSTFGQIRNAFISHYKDLYIFKKNQGR